MGCSNDMPTQFRGGIGEILRKILPLQGVPIPIRGGLNVGGGRQDEETKIDPFRGFVGILM